MTKESMENHFLRCTAKSYKGLLTSHIKGSKLWNVRLTFSPVTFYPCFKFGIQSIALLGSRYSSVLPEIDFPQNMPMLIKASKTARVVQIISIRGVIVDGANLNCWLMRFNAIRWCILRNELLISDILLESTLYCSDSAFTAWRWINVRTPTRRSM